SGRAGGILCEHAGAADGRLRRSEICGIGGAGEEVRSGGVRKRRAAVRAAGGSFAAGEVTGAASAGTGDAHVTEYPTCGCDLARTLNLPGAVGIRIRQV